MYLGQYRSWWQFCTLWDGNTAKCGWLGTGDGTSQWQKERSDRIIPESKNSNSQGKEHCFSRVITLWSLRSIASHPAPGLCRLLFCLSLDIDEGINSKENIYMLETVTLFPHDLLSSMPHTSHISPRLLLFFGWLFIICATVDNQQGSKSNFHQ